MSRMHAAAPRCRKSSAMALPMPLAPPVTTATLPVNMPCLLVLSASIGAGRGQSKACIRQGVHPRQGEAWQKARGVPARLVALGCWSAGPVCAWEKPRCFPSASVFPGGAGHGAPGTLDPSGCRTLRRGTSLPRAAGRLAHAGPVALGVQAFWACRERTKPLQPSNPCWQTGYLRMRCQTTKGRGGHARPVLRHARSGRRCTERLCVRGECASSMPPAGGLNRQPAPRGEQ